MRLRFASFKSLSFALLVGIFFIACASESRYAGGIGSFKGYEGLQEYNSSGPTKNSIARSYNSAGEGFVASLVEPDAYSLRRGGGSTYMLTPGNGTTPYESFGGGFGSSDEDSLYGGMRESAAIQRATMRPYTIAGKTYYPTQTRVGDTYDGIASWYGPTFHEKATSNGETYNMYAHTAASKTLPMNTVVKVFNKDNGKVTVVRINDRGPFVDGRIIDLSNVAARDIAMVDKGTANVRLEVIGFGGMIAKQKENSLSPTQQGRLDSSIKVGGLQNSATPLNYAVQVGTFSKKEGASFLKQSLEAKTKNYKVEVSSISNKYRVLVKGFKSEGEAQDFMNSHSIKGVIIAE
ncbi:septal ring lytic transglycosylase RlpA family protein [Helicobacter sp. 11S02629-2]|uniref:septal ring lytic transglycosylase RlpA family protein n=1 Tax=Helicobacter sp. 11S02629-2 TaxID=1476195 RepID=UPI000BA66EAE|nr:septal ring lytic transglycosylase RlpA family protein [Helicobacter sp. 11S02629-2]PAF43503.1 hypothetical protein BKH40_06905 [Helicobacter sp. 11S02629-2]